MNYTSATISSQSSCPAATTEKLTTQKIQKQDDKAFFNSLCIQPKLTIEAAGDPLEKEADDMADKVMRVETPGPINFSSSNNSVNRKCAHCEEEEQLQRKERSNDSISVAPSIVHDVINSSGGRSLDAGTRSFMEPRFNYDFSNVKIHDNDIAIKSAYSINALAYTSGNNIVFNSGQYNPNSDSGKRLLAHELTHVVQQGNNVNKKIQKLGANPACTAPERRGIHQAIFDARAWINNALAKIDQSPRHPRVLPALRRNFGPTYGAESNLALITGRIRAAFRALGTMSVACDTPGTTFWCAANRGGWTNGAGSNEVTICTNPPSTLSFPTYAIHILLHESFHAAMSFMTIDNYTATAGYPGAGTEPLLNADSYAQFVQELS